MCGISGMGKGQANDKGLEDVEAGDNEKAGLQINKKSEGDQGNYIFLSMTAFMQMSGHKRQNDDIKL